MMCLQSADLGLKHALGVPACRQVLVQWTTLDVGSPVVQVGTAPGVYSKTFNALSATYTAADLFGQPATTFGYFFPVRRMRAWICCAWIPCAWIPGAPLLQLHCQHASTTMVLPGPLGGRAQCPH